jgi:hypothetical protein
MENEHHKDWFYTIVVLMIVLITIILLRIVLIQVKKLITVSQTNASMYSMVVEGADLKLNIEDKYFGLIFLNKQNNIF